eukprot:620184-Prymnesium_polylepis.1
MIKQLDERFIDDAERPSNTRLVQCWMSKQRAPEKWLPEGWRVLAKGLYLGMLREAAKISGTGLSSSPRKLQKTSAGSSSLVRNLSDDDDGDDAPALLTDNSDTVTEEATRWAALGKKTVREYTDDDGI